MTRQPRQYSSSCRGGVCQPSARRHLKLMVIALGISQCCTGAMGSLTPYTGVDRVTTASIAGAANSLAAEQAWLSAVIGPIHTVDFESMATGTSGPILNIAPGVTASVQHGSFYPDNLHLETAPNRYAPSTGFNTTAGGSNHLRYERGSGTVTAPRITFVFAQPIDSFSLFITGEGEGPGFNAEWWYTKMYLNNSIHPAMGFGDGGFPYWPSTLQPNARFGGFTGAPSNITMVTLEFRFHSSEHPWHGQFSIDDVRWVYSVPAPGSLALLPLAGVCGLRRRRLTR